MHNVMRCHSAQAPAWGLRRLRPRAAIHCIAQHRPLFFSRPEQRSMLSSGRILNQRALLAVGTLSIVLSPRCCGAYLKMSTASGDVSSDLKAKITEVLKVYSSKDGAEQGRIVNTHYREDAHFIDPLMDCKGREEIALAFFSLIKIFSTVEVDQKGSELLPAHTLPTELQGQDLQQVAVRNQQVYHLERSGFMSKHLFPEVVDIDVTTTFTVDPKSGMIVRHTDVWNNKGFGMASFLKRPNGALSGGLFKMLGWKKQVYPADLQSAQSPKL